MADTSNEQILVHIGYLREDMAELKQLQREANGRTGKLESRVTLVENRIEEQRSPSNRASATISAIVSGAISGIGVWLAQK